MMEKTNFIAYETAKPLEKYSCAKAYFTLPFRKKTTKHFFRFILIILRRFFLTQVKQKIHITRIPVSHVDHPLDEKIKFTPQKVKIYLDFVGFFIRIFSMFLTKFNKKTALKYSADFFDFLTSLYENAYQVYSKCLTTTNRPHYKKTFRFLIIHIFDPHLLCVPSLHVAIVAGSYAFVRNIFETDDTIFDDEKNEILREIYFGAVAIIETVLYIKQHSINCVGAAFFMLTATKGKQFFSENDAKMFTTDLFKNQNDIEESDKIKIQQYIFELYQKFLLNAESKKEWSEVVLEFLEKMK